jgi:hypothetical protein
MAGGEVVISHQLPACNHGLGIGSGAEVDNENGRANRHNDGSEEDKQ